MQIQPESVHGSIEKQAVLCTVDTGRPPQVSEGTYSPYVKSSSPCIIKELHVREPSILGNMTAHGHCSSYPTEKL